MKTLLSALILSVHCVVQADEIPLSRVVTFGETTVTVYQDSPAREVPTSLFGDFSKEDIEAAIGTNKLMIQTEFFSIVANDMILFIDSGTGGKDSPLNRVFPPRSRIRQPDAFLITHGHGDHVGGLLLDGAPRFVGAKVYMSKHEIAYWSTEENKDTPAGKVIALYGDRIVPFDFDTEILPGIWARNAVGHTPGSTVFETKDIYFVGDLLHVAALQFTRPDACTNYDMDKPTAIAARKEWLTKAATEGKPIAGAHFGIGRVERDGEGFKFNVK